MKPSPFHYLRANSLNEVLAALTKHGDDAKILAGGQSLIPTMNMRFAAPELLIDVSEITELQGIRIVDGRLRIGAMSRHCDVLNSPLVKTHAPLIAGAMPHVAHVTIRNQGTFGGSLCQADPASELPACILALEARMNIQNQVGQRVVNACDFFQGAYTTCLTDDEVLLSVDVPTTKPNSLHFFQEVTRRHGDFALAGLCACVTIDDSFISHAKLVFFGVSDKPVSATSAEKILCGTSIDDIDVNSVCAAIEKDITPLSDLTTSCDAKRAIMKILAQRSIASFANAELNS